MANLMEIPKEDEKLTITPSTSTTPMLEPLSEKTWAFDPSVDLNAKKSTKGEHDILYDDFMGDYEAFLPDEASEVKKDIATRGNNPFSGTTDIVNAKREERDFFKDVFMPEQESIGKESIAIAGDSAYEPEFSDILPLLAVALFSDDNAFNEGFYKSYNASKQSKHANSQNERIARLQDQAKTLETKAAFLAKNTAYYTETNAHDKVYLGIIQQRIESEKSKLKLGYTPVILKVVTENMKEQVDALKTNRFVDVKSNDTVLKQIMGQLPDKGASLTTRHKDLLLEVYNTEYVRHMTGANIMGNYAKGSLDPVSTKDTSNAVQTHLFNVPKFSSEISSKIGDLYKKLESDPEFSMASNGARKNVDSLNKYINNYNTDKNLTKDKRLTLSKLMTMTDDEIENLKGIGTAQHFRQGMPELLPTKTASMLIEQKNLLIKNTASFVEDFIVYNKSNLDESRGKFKEVFSKIAGMSPEYTKETARINSAHGINIVDIATDAAVYLSSRKEPLQTSAVVVSFLANPEAWKIMEDINTATKKNSGRVEDIEFFQKVKVISKGSGASIKEKQDAVIYLTKSAPTLYTNLYNRYEHANSTGKKPTKSNEYAAMEASITAATKSEKGFLYNVPISSIEDAQNAVYTIYQNTRSSNQDLEDVLSVNLGFGKEEAHALAIGILNNKYKKSEDLKSIMSILIREY